ncbi:MAG: DNA ligase [Stenotrophomonas sp.]
MLRALLFLVLCVLTISRSHAAVPPLMLASTWQDGPDVSQYLVSEKLDGVRARWDGKVLWTRAGHRIHAPAWFTAHWPQHPLDGELWLARGQFEATSALVRSGSVEDVRWRALRFMAFDLPAMPAGFADRHAQMGKLIGNVSTPYLRIIEQHRLSDTESLHRRLRAVVQAGGEGLMLHHQDNRYSAGRSNGLFKLKLHEDAEARVTGYIPGKGKYAGKVGALLVENDKGHRFRIGSGLSDAQRDDPPPIGALVTYRYNGLTVHGLPRFPRFLRLRPEP